MPSHHDSFRFLTERAQEMFGDVRSMLYVGHRGDTHPWWRTEFASRIGGPRIEVLDIDRGNLGTASDFAAQLHLGDVRHHPIAGYGLVFWDEGPEHVSRDEALALLARLAATNDHVLVSCPWGMQPQGSGPEDPEFHHWAPQPADFEGIGFMAEAFGVMFDGRGNGHGNLIAWV